MKKRRANPPLRMKVAILYQADHTCCMCRNRRHDVQLHHINGNPADNSPDNLIVLCPNCHSEVMRKGGLGQMYSQAELKKIREEWFAQVSQRRQRAETTKLDTDLSALAAFEVRRIRYEIEDARTDWNKLEQQLWKLSPYARDFNYPVRSEVASAALIGSDCARLGMPAGVAQALATVLSELLPVGAGGLRAPSRRKISNNDQELTRRVIATARGLAWDACRYLRNQEILEKAVYVLYAALRFARLNKLKRIEQDALQAFNVCIGICHEKRAGETFAAGEHILRRWLAEAQSES